jgi:hypothetical protein
MASKFVDLRLFHNLIGTHSQFGALLGRCNLWDSTQQNTPNRSQPNGSLRITHRFHPLAGEIVKVLRQKGSEKEKEFGWIIQLPDGNTGEIPHEWGIPVADDRSAEPDETRTQPLLAGVTQLLSLAKMCAALQVAAHEEAEDEPTGRRISERTSPASLDSGLDRTAEAETTGTTGHPGGDAVEPPPAAGEF